MEMLIDSFMDSNWGVKIAVFIPFLIAAANLLTVFVPSVKDNKAYNMVMGVLNRVALNVHKNKNADDTPK